MRWDHVYFAGAAFALGEQVPVQAAVDAGRYTREEADRSGQRTVTIAPPGVTGLDLAVSAGRVALKRSGVDSGNVGMVTFSPLASAQMEMWNSGSFVQRELGITARVALPAEVRSCCGGGLASLHLAAFVVSADDQIPAALITAGDVFPDEIADRWSTPGVVLGDGGSAVVLSREAGFARLLSSAVISDAELEPMHRGDHWGVNTFPVDLRPRVKGFLRSSMPLGEVTARRAAGMRDSVDAALRAAGVSLSDVAFVVYSNIALPQLEAECLTPLGITVQRTTWDFGRRTGHMGAADPFAAVAHLVESRRARPGDLFVLAGGGGGYVWVTVVGQVLEVPSW